jgi:glycosyltransferase involved in cell wall biosynthesis/O-antigen/teichoic acid export membrane protein
MNLFSRQNLSGVGALIVAMMLANFLNFAFNAFMGRMLSYADFGTIVFYNTVLSIVAITFNALSTTINHRVSYLNGKYHREAGTAFTRFVRARSTYVGLALIVIWIAMSWALAGWFNIANAWDLVLFSPVFLFGMITAINKGYLQGNMFFLSVGLVFVLESLIRLVVGVGLVFVHLDRYVYLSLPIALFSSFVLAWFFVASKSASHSAENEFRFPKRFYGAALLTSLSTVAFLSVDVMLAKHYLDPVGAGEYSLLSLVGSMVYFAGSILSGFMVTFISHDDGEHANPLKTFYWLMGGSVAITAVGVLAVGTFGWLTVPILFGAKADSIVPLLQTYTFAVGLFTLSSVVTTYHLARRHYSFAVAVMLVPILLVIGIFLKHDSISAIAHVYLLTSILGGAIIAVMHVLKQDGRFILANAVDLLNLFAPLEKQAELKTGGKRILIMNWRDTKHAFAGGAEVYVHELAKRWVRDGNQVTQFCGNDGQGPRNETVDGVRVIRRGGFYFVYFWAFVYYIMRFRGRFDLIIDCQNGVPFFTPLYAKEKVYSLLFHVHQDVFYRYLPKPLAAFASILENRVMPYAYNHAQFLTISESSRRDMEKLDLHHNVEIIFPGINLALMGAGEKSPDPTVLYLGRLKAYKSVDVLIKAFQKVLGQVHNAKLLIAGAGEEHSALKKLAEDLGIARAVEFLGKVTEQEKIQLMQKAWVFVNPSMMEGWGITTIEANACGTPVVAADVPGLRDSVKNPHTGYLVEHGNADLMAEKIAQILTDEKLRAEMSLSAIDWAKNFDWELSSRKGLEILYAE